MENENSEINSYSFLLDEIVEKNFADVNILLLSGKHIDQKFYTEYTILEDYELQWRNFYNNLYRLDLIVDMFEGNKCYYLDFKENGKGQLSDISRNKELTELQTLIGLILLDIYYQKYFDEKKVIYWKEIKIQILESEHQEAYKQILFNVVRESYDEKEWGEVHTKFSRTIDNFDHLGWVKKQSGKNDELIFEIRPAIHRLAKLYQYELQNFGLFIQRLKKD